MVLSLSKHLCLALRLKISNMAQQWRAYRRAVHASASDRNPLSRDKATPTNLQSNCSVATKQETLWHANGSIGQGSRYLSLRGDYGLDLAQTDHKTQILLFYFFFGFSKDAQSGKRPVQPASSPQTRNEGFCSTTLFVASPKLFGLSENILFALPCGVRYMCNSQCSL